MKGRIKDMGFGLTGELTVTLALPRHHADEVKGLLDTDVSVDLKKWRNRRSLSANAYAWVLITKIAQSMTPPLNKEQVYLEMLKRYGQGGLLSIEKAKAVEVLRAIDYWEHKGAGHVKGKDFVHVMVYIGSSKYDSKEMSVFVDGIVSEAKDLGIETMTPAELEAMYA